MAFCGSGQSWTPLEIHAKSLPDEVEAAWALLWVIDIMAIINWGSLGGDLEL